MKTRQVATLGTRAPMYAMILSIWLRPHSERKFLEGRRRV